MPRVLRGLTARLLTVLLASLVLLGVMVSGAAAFSDVTVTRRAKLHQPYRQTITLRVWRRSPHGHSISWRESHNTCSAVNPNGRYRGKWQMSSSLWNAYGGRAFARTADRATCHQQDIVARRIWVDQWWWPWGG
jgi:hypothetical protein